MGKSAYKLDLPDHSGWNKKHNVFNEALLKPYPEPEFEEQRNTSNPPGPIEVDNEEEYEVEAILDSKIDRRRRGRPVFYLVKWKGYPDANNTWEPVANVKNSQQLVNTFHKNFPEMPRPEHINRGIVLTLTEDIRKSLKPMFVNTEPDHGDMILKRGVMSGNLI